MLADLLTLTCSITARSAQVAVDEYGDEAFTETVTTAVCELQQRQRSETGAAGEVSSSEWLLILPAGTSIDTGDTVTVDEIDYEVTGEPWQARNPRTGAGSHIECTLRRTAGTEGS